MFRKKVTNEGFSLVEILVSMVILGIIFVPLTRNFIVAMHANEKARIMQQATAIGQSVMEQFKTEDIKDLAVDYSLDSGDLDGTGTAAYSKEITSGSKKFKATITISSTGSTALNTINNTELAKIYSMESSSNFIIQAPALTDWNASAYKTDQGLSNSISDIEGNLIRRYYIHVEKDSTTGYAKVWYQIGYYMNGYGEFLDGASIPEVLSTELQNVFLYYPIENSQNDEVELVNSDNFSFNLYVIGTPSSASYSGNCINKADIPGFNADINSTGGVHLKSNVKVIMSSGTQVEPINDDAYVSEKQAKKRRYSVDVLIQDESGTTDYAKLNSTRGE